MGKKIRLTESQWRHITTAHKEFDKKYVKTNDKGTPTA